jgi:hypothetical protein
MTSWLRKAARLRHWHGADQLGESVDIPRRRPEVAGAGSNEVLVAGYEIHSGLIRNVGKGQTEAGPRS